jgi:hypothetical protein
MAIEKSEGMIKGSLKSTLGWTICLFILGAFVSAQEPETDNQKSYYIEKTTEGFRFIQQLSWFPEEFAYQYEVTIEKQDHEGGYTQVLNKITQESFINCSLHPGNYRYQVKVYDLLERPGVPLEWKYFEILPALQPELSRFSPEVFYLNEDTSFTLTITGRNLIKGSEIYLQSQNDPERRIIPQNYNPAESGKNARLNFDIQTLIPDGYDIFVRNPGGLEATLRDFKIDNQKPFKWMISIDYAPLFPLYGAFFNDFLDTTFIPLSFAAGLDFIAFKYPSGSIGFELSPSWLYWVFPDEGYSFHTQFLGLQVNMFFQKWLFHRTIALNFHLGGGIIFMYDMHFEYGSYQTKSMFTLIPVGSARVSLQWFIQNPFFIELGLEFTHLFSIDKVPPGYIRSTLGIGRFW